MTRLRDLSRPAGRVSERGSALITVILVALVLTVVGLGIAYFASTEDRTSGNVRMAQTGFYAAEAGLRDAETAVTTYLRANSGAATNLLAKAGKNMAKYPAGDLYEPPGGGRPAYLLKGSAGMAGLEGRDFSNVLLPAPPGDTGTRTRAMYTVFIRNNEEDGGGDNADNDNRVNLIVVGQAVLIDGSGNVVVDAAGNPTIGITKVLEEQLDSKLEGLAAATQKGANAGGTSAGVK